MGSSESRNNQKGNQYVLAFFSVVASYSNLSTVLTVQRYI